MMRPSLDETYLKILMVQAARATCARRKVAAIITDVRGVVLGTGINGTPTHFPHCVDTPCLGAKDEPGNNENCQAVHAEQNAIMQAADRIEKAWTMYCSCTPCFTCAKMICNTPIHRVVVSEPYADERGLTMLKYARIEIVIVATKS